MYKSVKFYDWYVNEPQNNYYLWSDYYVRESIDVRLPQ